MLLEGIALVAFAIVAAHAWTRVRAPGFDVRGKHVVVTGGSSGLGLATAIKLAQQGARLTLVSRSQSKLEAARACVLKECKGAKVDIRACDVTDFAAFKAAMDQARDAHDAPCEVLICSAGLANPGYASEQDVAVFESQMNLNYFGSVNAVKAVLPGMRSRKGGSIVFISSACGLIGIVGYAQYCPTKYAVRGLADCLRNELVRDNIRVSIFYPANMSTPGFEEEEKTKPVETREIEGSASTQTAAQAADYLLKGLREGQYAITNDPMTELLRIANSGVAPRNNIVLEMLLAPLLVLGTSAFAWYADHVVRSHRPKKTN